jgi:uncharacterized protein (DUF2164 family)
MTDRNQKIEIPKEKKQELIAQLQTYFLKERDEELGDLAALLLLDFIIEKIGPEIYNKGINDSYSYFNDKIIDVLGLQK